MSDSNGNGVQLQQEVEVVERIVPKGNSHLVVEITQECYDAVKAIAEQADSRGLQSSFEFWLCRLANQHSKVQENLWTKADDISIFTRAKKGNVQSQIAVLASMGIKGATPEAAKKFFAQFQK